MNESSCRKHGFAMRDKTLRPRLYRIWCAMRWRCNPANKYHQYYHEKHIKVCDEWNEFLPFFSWAIENGYSDTLSIDRIDNNGDYEPANCRWVDAVAQANNKSNNHNISHNGETHTLSEWARITGINYSTLRSRVNRQHLPFEKAILKGMSARDPYTGRYIGGYENADKT